MSPPGLWWVDTDQGFDTANTGMVAPRDLRRAAQQRGQAQAPGHHRAGARWRMPTRIGRGRQKFRFKNKLVSVDSTVIDLCATLFDWAKFRRTKGAVKLHCLLDHDGYLPSVVVITEGKRYDVRGGSHLALRRGHRCGDGPRVRRLRVIWATDRAGGVLRHAPEGPHGVPGGRAAPGAVGVSRSRGITCDRPRLSDHPPRGVHERTAGVARVLMSGMVS